MCNLIPSSIVSYFTYLNLLLYNYSIQCFNLKLIFNIFMIYIIQLRIQKFKILCQLLSYHSQSFFHIWMHPILNFHCVFFKFFFILFNYSFGLMLQPSNSNFIIKFITHKRSSTWLQPLFLFNTGFKLCGHQDVSVS